MMNKELKCQKFTRWNEVSSLKTLNPLYFIYYIFTLNQFFYLLLFHFLFFYFNLIFSSKELGNLRLILNYFKRFHLLN